MLYRNGYSLLGYGCMRLPSDYEDAEKLILHALEKGVNYFDTAYVYKGNETLLGKIISKNNCRKKMRIATKLPVYLVKKKEDFDRFFDKQLERLQTNYVDNYLMHMLPDTATWNRLKKMGITEWLEEKKKKGQIRRVGFSFHGSSEIFIELLNAYDWEFCQVQYNYMDENSQAGRKGVEAAFEKNIPVIIMEPLRGGRLTNGLSDRAKKLLEKTEKSPAEWGLSWLYAQKQISCVLSGMNTMEMLDENIRIASKEYVFTEHDYNVITKVKETINSEKHIGCTGCRYCMPCPKGVDIPGAFRCYNASFIDGFFSGEREYVMALAMKEEQGLASQCIQCGKCEKLCPQQIQIRQELMKVQKRLESPVFKVIKFFSDKFFKKTR